MKIAFLVNKFPSITETFILSQINGLLDRNHEVTIFAKYGPGNWESLVDTRSCEIRERTIYPSIPRNPVRRTMKALKYVAKYFFKYPMPILRSLNVVKYGRSAASLSLLYDTVAFFENGPYDIIHGQFGVLGLDGLRLKQIFAKTLKLVTSFRGFDASKCLRSTPDIFQELFKEGDLFLAVCKPLKARIIQHGCPKEKSFVLPSGINIANLKYSVRQLPEGKSARVVTIGRLVEKKGIEYAIRAVSQVIASGRKISYCVVGDGILKGKLERLIAELGLRDHIEIVGWKTPQETFQLLEDAHILIAPSVTATNGDQEGIPNVMKEAMAMGMPVISTLHSGIPELVSNNVSGYLVRERDVEALSDRLMYLLDHPEIWSRMGRAGRALVETSYDSHRLNDRLIESYQRLINSKQPVLD